MSTPTSPKDYPDYSYGDWYWTSHAAALADASQRPGVSETDVREEFEATWPHPSTVDSEGRPLTSDEPTDRVECADDQECTEPEEPEDEEVEL